MLGSFSHADTMGLDGKIVLVTGAGRGIGKALALGFAKAGAHVVVVSRTQTEIEATACEAQTMASQSLVIKVDVSQPHEVQRMAELVGNRFGRLDVLVNNAALRMNQLGKKDSYYIPFVNLNLDDWDSAMNVNLRGPFLCIKECLPLMQRSGAGSIINISAGGGKKGMAGRVPYCASKFGLEGLTQCLALEFHAYDIAVNSFSRQIFDPDRSGKNRSAERQFRPHLLAPGNNGTAGAVSRLSERTRSYRTTYRSDGMDFSKQPRRDRRLARKNLNLQIIVQGDKHGDQNLQRENEIPR
jgi:NAD(P)-dependent dehydrogenase (short-subunit alcohol dehydrogenase family)